MKVLIYIVCYNAERHIRSVLQRIPARYRSDPHISVLISDDCSADATARTAFTACKDLGYGQFEVFRTRVNQGYGGNQKIGYNYACRHGFDYVVLLHGDGQYAPEELDRFFALFEDRPDIILGSRMMIKRNALRGKMPVIRFVSNIILTRLQNVLAGTDFAEFHTGYRAYSTAFLREVPFELNSNGFDFDTDILLQARFLGKRITEFPIPTHYGHEKSNVPLIRYGIDILRTTLQFRMQQIGIGCSLKFRGSKALLYKDKFGYRFSTHYYLMNLIREHRPARILEIGSGAGYLAERLRDQDIRITGIDLHAPGNSFYRAFFQADIEQFDWSRIEGEDEFDMVCLMDVLEHLKEPERVLLALRNDPRFENALFVISVPNVAFFSIRIGLLLGWFHYADRGILDIDHKRLFTRGSFQSMLRECGFRVCRTIPVPPPFELLGSGFLFRAFGAFFNLLAGILPGWFSFQILKTARPIPVSTNVINNAVQKLE